MGPVVSHPFILILCYMAIQDNTKEKALDFSRAFELVRDAVHAPRNIFAFQLLQSSADWRSGSGKRFNVADKTFHFGGIHGKRLSFQ